MILGSLFKYISIALGGMLLLLSIYTSIKISAMSDDIEVLTSQRDVAIQKVGICKANNSTLKASLDELNDKIYSLKIDRKTRVQELKKWKLQARKVRYKVIYKTEEIKSNECKDIKNTINTIRNLDFSSL